MCHEEFIGRKELYQLCGIPECDGQTVEAHECVVLQNLSKDDHHVTKSGFFEEDQINNGQISKPLS